MPGWIVVTGGAAGLGRVIASALLDRGRAVALLDHDEPALQACVEQLGSGRESRITGSVADLSTTEGIRAAASDVAGLEDLTALVNNAGGWLPGEQFPDAPPERWMSALTLNLVAPMLLTQLLWPTLSAARGAVVSIGSSGGLGDAAYGSPEYGAAKAGIRRFTTSLGARDDVRVMAVVPGWIGLERAQEQWAALPEHERSDVGPLVAPDRIAGVVCDLLERGRPGEVVEVLRGAERAPVPRDPRQSAH